MKPMVWMNHFVKMTMGISLLYSLLQVITATIVIKGFAPHVRQLVTYTLGIGRNEKEYKHNLITVKQSCRNLSGISVTYNAQVDWSKEYCNLGGGGGRGEGHHQQQHTYTHKICLCINKLNHDRTIYILALIK